MLPIKDRQGGFSSGEWQWQ